MSEQLKLVNTYHERLCLYIQGILDSQNCTLTDANIDHIEMLLLNLVNDSLKEALIF